MEETYDMPYKNPSFFVTTEPNWTGFSAAIQIISYSKCCNPKVFSDQFTIPKDIDAESLIVIFSGTISS